MVAPLLDPAVHGRPLPGDPLGPIGPLDTLPRPVPILARDPKRAAGGIVHFERGERFRGVRLGENSVGGERLWGEHGGDEQDACAGKSRGGKNGTKHYREIS